MKTKGVRLKDGQSLRRLKVLTGKADFHTKDTATAFNRKNEILAYKVKTTGKFGGQAIKSTAHAGGNIAIAKLYESINEGGESTQDTEQLLHLGGQKIHKNVFRGGKIPLHYSRQKVEKKILGEKIKTPISAKTAFSPYKTRREMFDRAYKKNRFNKRLVRAKGHIATAKKAMLAAQKHARNTHQIGGVVRRATSAVIHALKAAISLARMAVSAVTSVIPWIAAIGIPILIIVVIVTAASPANEVNQNGSGLLTSCTASGQVTAGEIHLTIYAEEEKILSFTSPNQEGRFIYTAPSNGATKATNINGKITGTKMTLKGTLQGEPISMTGQVNNGKCRLEGFWGELAEDALNGEWHNPFGRTKYVITSEFGVRVHPITGEVRQHDGYDLCATTGVNTRVYAAAAGKVSTAGRNGGYGNCVVIDHGKGLQSLYGHLNGINVKVGDVVKVGTRIGSEGNTGNSTGSHLHFEVRKDGTAIDGKNFLKTLYTNATSIDVWS